MDWNGDRKHIFSKTLSRVEIFENAGFPDFLLRLDRRKRRFSNTMMSYIEKRQLTTSLYRSITHAQ